MSTEESFQGTAKYHVRQAGGLPTPKQATITATFKVEHGEIKGEIKVQGDGESWRTSTPALAKDNILPPREDLHDAVCRHVIALVNGQPSHQVANITLS